MIVGRDTELARLRELTTELAAGRGRVVWVEGEPGIGKSALLAEGLGGAETAGCQLLSAAADELGQRLPLRVILDALGVHRRSRDPRRARVAQYLEAPAAASGFGSVDPMPAAIERVLALVDQLCADSPVVLVIDDLQWADEASLLVWQRLSTAVGQIPLLLVGATRPVPRRPELTALRQRIREPHAVMLRLDALTADESGALASQLIGATPGSGLLVGLARAAGNPLYVTEIVNALLRESGVDGLQPTTEEHLPDSLTEAIATRFGFLSDPTTELLRLASLLGTEFTVTDLATVATRTAASLVASVEEATAAGVLIDAGTRLRFRHPLFRHTLYNRMPLSLRDALHLQSARTLAEAGSPLDRVAQQLLLVTDLDDAWAHDWLTTHAADLTYGMPTLARDLLTHAADHLPVADPRRETLELHLASAAFLLARYDDVLQITSRLLAQTKDTERAGNASWLHGYALIRLGRYEQATAAIEDTRRRYPLSQGWTARLQALDAMSLICVSRYDDAALIIDDIVGDDLTAVDRIAAGYALHVKSLIVYRPGRDRTQMLAVIDRALTIIGDDQRTTDLRMLLMLNRAASLLDLDRLEDGEETYAQVRLLAEHAGTARADEVRLRIAECQFESGRWDDARAELDSFAGLFDTHSSPVWGYGIAALIAGHRDDRAAARRLVSRFAGSDLYTPDNRACASYMLAARAILAEREGDLTAALACLVPILEHAAEWDNLHLVLTDLVRLALATGQSATAEKTAVVAADAASRDMSYLGAIAMQCRAAVDKDPAPMLGAIDSYFRQVRRPLDLARALEDAAVLYAERNDPRAARRYLNEAIDLYTGLGATWDIRRADTRLRPLGIRRGVRGSRHRPATGWDALTPTESTVAHLVAQGRSNPEIAAELFLARSTVQTHVSHILGKLGLHSRGQVAHTATQRPSIDPAGNHAAT